MAITKTNGTSRLGTLKGFPMLGYIWLSKAWYAKTSLKNEKYVDEIMIGTYDNQGGTDWEFAIRWYDLRLGSERERDPSAHIEIFDDAWSALNNGKIRELFSQLSEAAKCNPTPEQIAELLDELGFSDRTPTIERRKRLEEPPIEQDEVDSLLRAATCVGIACTEENLAHLKSVLSKSCRGRFLAQQDGRPFPS